MLQSTALKYTSYGQLAEYQHATRHKKYLSIVLKFCLPQEWYMLVHSAQYVQLICF